MSFVYNCHYRFPKEGGKKLILDFFNLVKIKYLEFLKKPNQILKNFPNVENL